MLEQIAIAFTGTVAIFLTQAKSESLRRYACLVGFAGQPFWMYATLSTEQWGMFSLTVLYTIAWAKGIYIHWLSEYFK